MSFRRVFWLAALLLPGAMATAQATETVVYYHTDALHSTTVVTNAQGQVIERTHYAPYGAVLNRALRDGPGYAGHEEDAATGLVYMQQRYYDPESGTFLSTDPVEASPGAGFNRYAYANDNPYRYVDPDGRSTGTLLKDDSFNASPVPLGQAQRALKATAALAIRMAARTATAVAGGTTAAGILLGGVALGAAVYPIETAPDDTMTAQAVKDYARPISSWKPERGEYLYRTCGGGSTCLFGNSWTPINPFFLRMAGVDFRDEAGLPNWNTGRYVARGQLVNPAGITEIKGADAFGTHGAGVPNRGGLIEYVIPNPQTTLQNITTTYSDPAF